MTLELLSGFFIRIFPGMAVAALMLILIPRKLLFFRISIYIMIFIFIRDAMTPAGLWSFGTEGFFWIRFVQDPATLILFGLSSIGFVFAMNRIDPACGELIEWISRDKIKALLTGAAGAVLVVLPVAVYYMNIDISIRGGVVPSAMIPAIFIISFGGNFYEEALFRGYVQGYLEKKESIGRMKAAVISGVMFSFCHIFLASTVTSIGYPILIFALYEGIIAAFVRMKYGMIPATITHGGAIFLLTGGFL